MLELYVACVHHFEELYLWANNAYVAHFCVHFGRIILLLVLPLALSEFENKKGYRRRRRRTVTPLKQVSF